MKLQACIGNRMSIMHIRDAEKTRVMNGDLVLCGSTVAFKDYRGQLRRNLICSKCARKAEKILNVLYGCGLIASDINVREII